MTACVPSLRARAQVAELLFAAVPSRVLEGLDAALVPPPPRRRPCSLTRLVALCESAPRVQAGPA
jgi:hypothetical protein